MRDLGSGGWGVFPDNTEVEVIDVSKGAGELPQKVMQEMADRVVDILILGQTLTTDVASGGSGNRALGQVHQDIRDEVLQNAVEYTASILNTQFVPAIIDLNYGNTDELPQFSGSVDQPQDEKALAERDKILFVDMQIPVALTYLREHNKLPAPAEDDELYIAPAPSGGGGFGGGSLAGALLTAAAASHTAPARPNLEALVDNVMENLTGVSSEWLKPVRPIFRDLVGLARDKTVTDQDFIRAIGQASQRMPDLFHQLDTESLEQELGKVLSSGLINGVTDRHIEEGPSA
jgi:phage gp29-like protein